MSRYYAFIAGAVTGPFEVEELKKILRPELQVCVEGTEQWSTAGSVPELAAVLFAAQSAAPSMPPLVAQKPAMPPLGKAPGTGGPPPLGKGPIAAAPPMKAKPEDAAPKDLPPKLRELWIICRNAPDELLLRQKKEFWKKFFKNEQQIIETEIKRRNLN